MSDSKLDGLDAGISPVIDARHGVTQYTYDFPPGTEVVDQSGKEENIHYPMPTDDPQDPLNWRVRYKWLCYGTFLWYLWAVNMAVVSKDSFLC